MECSYNADFNRDLIQTVYIFESCKYSFWIEPAIEIKCFATLSYESL